MARERGRQWSRRRAPPRRRQRARASPRPGVVLVSYDVHAAGTGHEAKASISVAVRRSDATDGPTYPGRAVHDNVLQASVEAYVTPSPPC